MQDRQVFQASTATRWQRVKWGSRVLIFIGIILLVAFIIAVGAAVKNTNMPHLQSVEYKPLKDTSSFIYKNSELARKYYGFRKFIDDRDVKAKTREPYQSFVPANFRNITSNTEACRIRAGFFVDWDPQSYYSLQRNVNKLNLVIPEWFFIDPKADTLISKIDGQALAIMQQSGVNIMPVLTNNLGEVFHGDAVHRILTTQAKRERLINDLIRLLKAKHFAGVNVDFEDLVETTDEPLIAFQKELYEKLHAHHLLVTQDVIPFNEDYNYDALAKYNDFLFVMAYDEFSDGTKAGPIAEQKWIEAAVDEATKKLPANKIILGLGAYGYDWPRNSQALPLTYQQALSVAKENDGKIEFNNDTYNLHFSYSDDNDVEHDVYFTDAATAFNTMRFATESDLAGTAIWRLGSEDSRIWDFYNLDMSKEAAQRFDFAEFSSIESTDDVDYNGQGEVLDVVSTPTKGLIKTEQDTSEMLISEENYVQLPSQFIVNAYGWNKQDTARNRKKIVLTFDDGPDANWTPRVLDILSEKHVPATFFVVGKNVEENIPMLKRIYREGHEIGNHTFLHPNVAEISPRRAVIEMESTRLLIECITGHSTVLFRAPYNADFTPQKWEELQPVALARTKNYLDIGESIDPEDWQPGVSADTIFQRVITLKQKFESENQGGNIVLLHDAGGETREATIEALPRIIDYFKQRGYTFTTVADYLGKKKDAVMPPVPKGSGYFLIQANIVLVETIYWINHILFSLFIIFIALSIARILLMAVLTTIERRKEKKAAMLLPTMMQQHPLVSIIVPAYNEEVNAVSSLQNLLKTDYPNFNVVFVDDGSKDDTYAKVADVFKDHPKVKVFTKPNGGKASALNYGISQTHAEFVVCIDADTKLHPTAVSEMMKHFAAEGVGAVAGNVKVGNEVNMLTRWQAIEYISSQNFDRRAFAAVNAITVVPGAIGAFRKKAIEDAGGFTTDTLAEDCDLTIRILRAGYEIRNENKALAFTEVPEKLAQFNKQRFRWSFGILQTFWKHKDVMFNKNYGWLGWLAMPNILLFQYIIPFFIPIADFFMLVGLFTGNASHILPYYIAFMLFDAAVAVAAFRLEKESIGRLIWLIPQRLIYRWIMWWVLFKAVRRAVKGELQSWGVLKRTGKVKEVMA
ncbi:polysaccharide deacetylase family protein [Flavisolibacter ginsenosidimutans]|uniref:Glycosyltransferase n=1 Tax=Flavisolibacter ginsenosidimutans TaxID=661481 RepID=A0A5B8UI96_9BACT|nr:glycosyltransferase [Flavisolibacter ginsenosidimutans]QEC56397.1 glycosyltransferase [Flavisolibacter ginsenosidimutans]